MPPTHLIGTILVSALLCCGAASTGAAQTAPASSNDLQKNQSTMNGQVTQNGAGSGAGSMSIRQGIQNQLQQAGYTDISVTPSSFFIHAKDKQGRPVAMVLGPDTFTEVTELPAGGSSSSGASGSSPGGGASSGGPAAQGGAASKP